jgi:uncharacterized protein YndB with AHSA1/START domain
MMADVKNKTKTLQIKRTFSVPREKVFNAWTNPEELKKWWHMADNWSTPIAEIDLRVGGKYRLGMQDPTKDFPHVVGGTFQEVKSPQKLVYTWQWEGQDEKTLVTVEFQARGNSTEVILTHGEFSETKTMEEHTKGWHGCLDQLVKIC